MGKRALWYSFDSNFTTVRVLGSIYFEIAGFKITTMSPRANVLISRPQLCVSFDGSYVSHIGYEGNDITDGMAAF